MWIELADSLPETFAIPTLHICSVLEAVASASFHGKHVLYGSRPTLQWVLQQNLSAPAKAAVGRALTTAAERGSVRETIFPRLTLEAGGQGVKRDMDGHWHAPIESLIGVTLQSVELLAENLRDAAALKIAALHFKKVRKLHGFEVSLIPHNGGGAEILPCFNQAIQSREKFTFAVTDSDKDHPGGTAGFISRECESASRNANWICNHLELPCREIENLLPFNLIDDSIRLSPVDADLYAPLDQVVTVCNKRSDALKYADLKIGTRGTMGTTSEQNPERRVYWEGVIEDCGLGNEVCNAGCEYDPCKCKILPGLGPKVLQRFLEYCSQTSILKQVERVNTSHHREDWLEVGKMVFNWGLADPPVRS